VKAIAPLLERVKDLKGKLFVVGEGWLKLVEE
jgi:hypothetical protein